MLEGVVRITIFLAFLSDCIIHQGAFLALLLIYKLIVDAVIKVCVIVLLVDSVFLTTLSAEFNHAAWHYKVGDILWPVIGRVVFLDFLDLVSLINENALDTVEWSQDKRLFLLVRQICLFVAHLCFQVVFGKENLFGLLAHV